MMRSRLAWIWTLAAGCAMIAQSPEAPEVQARETAPSFRIRVDTNLVTVPVVVRDSKGRAVSNLEKKDFRLLDSGKPQEITGFRVEITDSKTKPLEPAATSQPATPPVAAPPTPQRFVALFFDDLHMPIEDIARTRNAAWRYLSAAVRPEDRVAMFTSSGKEQVDFTNDRDKLHDALFRLAARSRTIPVGNRCPSIEEYQAYLIDQVQDANALAIAAAEGRECHCTKDDPACVNTQARQARFDAAQIWDLADQQSQAALEAIQTVLRRLSAMPGQRSMVIVSAGFLMMTRTNDMDILINRALQKNIVINAIDSAGLYTRSPRTRLAGVRMDLEVSKNGIENAGRKVQRDVMAGLSAGTGGVFFENSNDFEQGFREAAQAPEAYYVLSFSPQNVKFDGAFHPLKVILNNSDLGRVSARRGYVASKAAAEQQAPAKTQIEELIFSLDELHGLPVEVTARQDKNGPASTLAVRIHVDVGLLHFRKEDGRNRNTLYFDTALFDPDGKYVAGKQASLELRLKDANFEKFVLSGINAVSRFQVPPGAYRVREVVRDSESKDIAAVNCSVSPAP